MSYHIVRYQNGKFDAIIAGCGRNKGTWDAEHSKSSAHYHAARLRKQYPGADYRVEPVHG